MRRRLSSYSVSYHEIITQINRRQTGAIKKSRSSHCFSSIKAQYNSDLNKKKKKKETTNLDYPEMLQSYGHEERKNEPIYGHHYYNN